jgi:hypothetical protein
LTPALRLEFYPTAMSDPIEPDEEPENSAAEDPPAEKPDDADASAEDQLADWEEALKNDDWGHQPC